MQLYVIIWGLCFVFVFGGDLPSYFPKCCIDDPHLDQCILDATETLRPYLKKGIPELNIPSFDPLRIPLITLQQGTDAVNYKVSLIDTKVYGFDKYKFTFFRYDTKELTYYGLGLFNSLRVETSYDIEGKILAIPLKGNGTLKSNLGSSTGALNVTGELVKRKEVDYYHPIDVKSTITVSDYKAHFDGLFNGNEELSRTTNDVLNANSKELIKEVLPAIEKVTDEFINRIMMEISSQVPYNKLFPACK